MTLGEKIFRARKRLDLSQQELADLLYVSRESVGNWEHDHTRPGRAHLHALEQVLGALEGSPEDLFTLTDAVRNSRELTGTQKQALLAALGDRTQGRHALTPYPAGW